MTTQQAGRLRSRAARQIRDEALREQREREHLEALERNFKRKKQMGQAQPKKPRLQP
jgi:hypothetical protein